MHNMWKILKSYLVIIYRCRIGTDVYKMTSDLAVMKCYEPIARLLIYLQDLRSPS